MNIAAQGEILIFFETHAQVADPPGDASGPTSLLAVDPEALSEIQRERMIERLAAAIDRLQRDCKRNAAE